VGIQATTANLVATGRWHIGFSESGQHRSQQHDGATQFCAVLLEVIRFHIIKINLICLESIITGAILRNFHIKITQNFDKTVYIMDIGDIRNAHLIFG